MRCLELVVTAFLLHSATSHAFETAALPPDPDHRLAAQAINRLGFDLFHRQSGKNPCISPYSIQLAMAMVANGTAGLTKEEFVKALHYPKDFSALNASMKALLAELGSHGELQTANRLYAQERKPIAPEFLEILSESYSAPLELLPFATQPEKSRQHINRWVKEATKDRISDALPAGSITSQTQFAFANAVHFKDNWVHQFRPEETTDQTFYLVEPLPERHTTPKVPTMMLFRDLGYLKRDTYTLVSLPFENGFEMLIVVPDERNGAYHLKEDFDAALMALLKKLPPQKGQPPPAKVRDSEQWRPPEAAAGVTGVEDRILPRRRPFNDRGGRRPVLERRLPLDLPQSRRVRGRVRCRHDRTNRGQRGADRAGRPPVPLRDPRSGDQRHPSHGSGG